MLMVVHFEINPERMKEAMEKTDQMRELIKKNPEEYPKFITPGFIYNGETKGFQVIEIEKPEQLMNIASFYMPEKKYICKQIIPASVAQEIWKKQFS